MKEFQATLPVPSDRADKANIDYDNKLRLCAWVVVGTMGDIMARAVCYKSSMRSNTVYANVWIYDEYGACSGSGKAGGYGYCKISAAVGDALYDAGVVFNQAVSGVGVSTMEDALASAAIATGGTLLTIVRM